MLPVSLESLRFDFRATGYIKLRGRLSVLLCYPLTFRAATSTPLAIMKRHFIHDIVTYIFQTGSPSTRPAQGVLSDFKINYITRR